MSTLMQQQVSCNATSEIVTFVATLNKDFATYRPFAEWVKKYRELAGLSQEGAAEKSGLSRYQWIRIENAQSGTKRSTVEKIAASLKGNVDEALSLAGYKSNNKSVIPEELAIIDYDGFNKDDLREIADYIEFKRAQKLKELKGKKQNS